MNIFFEQSFAELVRLEGGYNDIAEDRGGATNYGISLRFLKLLPEIEGDIDKNGHVDKEDIKAIDEEDAKKIYFKHFWEHYKIDSFPQHIQKRLFHTYVNMRGKTVNRILQRAIRSASTVPIADDGVLGEETKKAMDMCRPEALEAAFKSEQAALYRLIVAKDDSQKIFLKGWLNRAYGD